jgi:chitinase
MTSSPGCGARAARADRFVRRLAQLVLCTAALLSVAAVAAAREAPPRLVGYVTAAADPADIEAGRLSHAIFAFAHVVGGQVVLDAKGEDAFGRLRDSLHARNPDIRLLISVGGWAAAGFSDAALTDASRQRFAQSAVALLRQTGADGLDVDWEYPGHHESGITARESDREHFTALLATLRQAFDRASQPDAAPEERATPRHLLLTAALADGPFVDHVQLAAVAAQLDWINAMTYDFNNAMTPTTGHHAGLFRSAAARDPGDRSTDGAVRQYLAAGVPRSKIVIGAAFYGRAFGEVNDRGHGLYQRYGRFIATYTWPQLVADYIDRNGFRRHWDARAQAPTLWNADSRTFISYEDPQSLRAKARYARAHHLGGVMYWEQSHDPTNQLVDALAGALGR